MTRAGRTLMVTVTRGCWLVEGYAVSRSSHPFYSPVSGRVERSRDESPAGGHRYQTQVGQRAIIEQGPGSGVAHFVSMG